MHVKVGAARCVYPNTPQEWPAPRRDDEDNPEYINPWETFPSRRTVIPEFNPPLDPDYAPGRAPSEVPPVGASLKLLLLSLLWRVLV